MISDRVDCPDSICPTCGAKARGAIKPQPPMPRPTPSPPHAALTWRDTVAMAVMLLVCLLVGAAVAAAVLR